MEWKNFPLDNKFDDFDSFDSNPFFKLIEEGGYIAKQQGAKFKASNNEMVDKNTGTISTVYVKEEKRKYVDKREFVKLPITGFESVANLSSSELRLLMYIFYKMRVSNDEVEIKPKDFMEYAGYTTRNPVYKALTGLLNKGFIAKSFDKNMYFINPLIFYKGTIIEKFFEYVFNRNKTEQENRFKKEIKSDENDEELR